MAIYYGNQKVAPSGIDKVYAGTNLVYTKGVTSYPITVNVTGGTYFGDESISVGSTAQVTLKKSSTYGGFPATISVTNASYIYNQFTGDIILSNPTDNVTINATCATSGWCEIKVKDLYNFNVELFNKSTSAIDYTVSYDTTTTFTYNPNTHTLKLYNAKVGNQNWFWSSGSAESAGQHSELVAGHSYTADNIRTIVDKSYTLYHFGSPQYCDGTTY